MRHDEAEPLIAALALGELDDEQRRAVEAHLAECEVCRQALAETRATVALLQEAVAALPREALDAGQVAAVLAVAQDAGAPEPPAAEVVLPGPRAVTPPRVDLSTGRRRRRRLWIGLGIAAVVALGFFSLVAPALSSSKAAAGRVLTTGRLGPQAVPPMVADGRSSTTASGAPEGLATARVRGLSLARAPELRQLADQAGRRETATVDPSAAHGRADDNARQGTAAEGQRGQGDALFFRRAGAGGRPPDQALASRARGTDTVGYSLQGVPGGGMGPGGAVPGAAEGASWGDAAMPGGPGAAAMGGMGGGMGGMGPGGMMAGGTGGVAGGGMGMGGMPGSGEPGSGSGPVPGAGMMPGMGPAAGSGGGVITPDVAFGSFVDGKEQAAKRQANERQVAGTADAWFKPAPATPTPAAPPVDRTPASAPMVRYELGLQRGKLKMDAAMDKRAARGEAAAAEVTDALAVVTAPSSAPPVQPPPAPAEPAVTGPVSALTAAGAREADAGDRVARVLGRSVDAPAAISDESVAAEIRDGDSIPSTTDLSLTAALAPAAKPAAAPESETRATTSTRGGGLAGGTVYFDADTDGLLGEAKPKTVPALGDLPLLGRRFGREDRAKAAEADLPKEEAKAEKLADIEEDLYAKESVAKDAAPETPAIELNFSTVAGHAVSGTILAATGRPRDEATRPEETVRVLVENLADLAPADRKRLSESLLESQAGALAQEQPLSEDELAGPPPPPPGPANPFVMTEKDRFSTFALEADTASYALARRYLASGRRPPPGLIRMEEFVNAFDYSYPAQSTRTFAVHAEAGPAPFGRSLTLLKVGVKARVLGRDGRKPAHLVFVIDTSGSMGREDRLPLVRTALGLMATQLDARDRLSLVTYDTQARLILEAIPAERVEEIKAATEALTTAATTNLLAGVELGYQIAARHFRSGETNRVILCTDGVANVGPADAEAVLTKVAQYRRQGITLTSVGVGSGSYDDRMLEQLANKGDGNYVFVDSPAQARRVFVDDFAGTLQMVARNAKIQVEFNPNRVRRYRLIGYENRDVADKDFRNDAVDAGEIGSGQAATALYEVELLPVPEDTTLPPDMGTVYVRYENVDTGRVEEISARLSDALRQERTAERVPRFLLAACSAEFAEILRESEHAREGSLAALESVATRVANALPLDQRVQELLALIRKAEGLPR